MVSSFARTFCSAVRGLRVGYCLGLSGLLIALGSESLQTAVAEGDTRTISLHHMHTGEDLTITYKVNGRYDDAALQKLNWELRDWRRGEAIRMDPRLIDLVWDVQHELGGKEPIQIVCGYRAPQTNAMLRRRSRGVAQFSQHTLGKAMDFYIPGVPLAELRAAGMRLQRGGVGFYPTSGSPFVHLDVGGIRYWPRMSHDQLVKIFPDEKTVYLPRDGRPLRNYALALAEVERRGSAPSQMSLAAARDAGAIPSDAARTGASGSGSNLLAKLFGFRHSSPNEEETDEEESASAPARTAAAMPTVVPTVPVPVPRSKPAASYQVASADTSAAIAPQPQAPSPTASLAQQPARAPIRAAQAASLVASGATAPPRPAGLPTPSTVINERGYWQGPEDAPSADATPRAAAAAPSAAAPPPEAPPPGRFATAAVALQRAIGVRRARAETASAADPQTTSSLGTVGRSGNNAVLAYAALPGTDAANTPARAARRRVVSRLPSAAVPPDTTIAVKNSAVDPIDAAEKVAILMEAVRSGERFEEPWLRSMVVASSSRGFLTTAMLGPVDYSHLGTFLLKPASTVVMTFGADPQQGLSDDRFSGEAVVFVPTMTFPEQTAQVQQ